MRTHLHAKGLVGTREAGGGGGGGGGGNDVLKIIYGNRKSNAKS